jgi:poly-gamma-glutamate synthesis protein (capsule biosynthesis protein)
MKHTHLAGWTLLPAALILGFVSAATVAVETLQAPPPQRNFALELANKMRGTYVVAAAGGFVIQEAIARQTSPALQRILREANTTIGHLEFYQADRAVGPTPPPTKELIKDVSDLGFDLLGLGITQGGDAALRAGLEALGGLSIPVARADRQPAFHNLASGRAVLINGPNPIRLSTAKFVTAEQLAQLKAIRDSIVARRNDPDVARPIGVPQDLPDQVTIFSDTFVLGPVAGEIREEPNSADRQANLMAVRNTKQYADFVAFSMPMPPTPKAAHVETSARPHEAVVALAHDLVDNGMDMYVGYGNHAVQGVEIYKGRPVFYNLGDLGVHRSESTNQLSALLATSTYQDGILQEVRIYPVDLGLNPANRPASTLGVPMTPSPEDATRILTDLQKASEPFGTRIAVENGVGVIRVPRDATQPIGQGIRDFGTFPSGGAAGGRGGRGGGRGGF